MKEIFMTNSNAVKNNSLWVAGDFTLWLINNSGTNPININLRKSEPLHLKLLGEEWAQLFYGVLGCPVADNYSTEDSLKDWLVRNEIKFRQSISNFPMLGELHDIHSKILFNQEQVKSLSEEVLRAIPMAKDNKSALEGLAKLATACRVAIEKEKFLYLNG